MDMKCPGSDINITIFECTNCKEEVELFSGEAQAKCTNCGTIVYREKASCIDWCEFAVNCFKSEDIAEAKKNKG